MHENTYPDTELLQVAMQDSRYQIISAILAHPEKQPSLKELDRAITSITLSTIRGHLQKLIDHEVVEERTLPKEDRTRDLPWKFFAVTDEAYNSLSEHDVLPDEEELSGIYSQAGKDETMQRYETAPRPE